MWFATDDDTIREAKQICAGCPARQPCLDNAMAEETNEYRSRIFGIRGGLTPAERWPTGPVQLCAQCGQPVPAKRGGRKTCSTVCRSLWQARISREQAAKRREATG
jgi:hypothetical protein